MRNLFRIVTLFWLTLSLFSACGDKETPNNQSNTANYLEGKTFYRHSGDVDMPRPRYYNKVNIQFGKQEIYIQVEAYEEATPDRTASYLRAWAKGSYTYIDKVLEIRLTAGEEEDLLTQSKKDISQRLQSRPQTMRVDEEQGILWERSLNEDNQPTDEEAAYHLKK